MGYGPMGVCMVLRLGLGWGGRTTNFSGWRRTGSSGSGESLRSATGVIWRVRRKKSYSKNYSKISYRVVLFMVLYQTVCTVCGVGACSSPRRRRRRCGLVRGTNLHWALGLSTLSVSPCTQYTVLTYLLRTLFIYIHSCIIWVRTQGAQYRSIDDTVTPHPIN